MRAIGKMYPMLIIYASHWLPINGTLRIQTAPVSYEQALCASMRQCVFRHHETKKRCFRLYLNLSLSMNNTDVQNF